MNVFLIFFLVSTSGHATTSFYTFHKIGAYGISNFNLDLGMNRFGFRIGLEKRRDDFGIKSLTVSVDSIVRDFRLTIGEKSYFLHGPLSTTLNFWGLSLENRSGNFFIGKTEDPGSFLSPSFKENRYMIGCRLQGNISYYVPVELYLLRKSDSTNHSGILENNSLGTNIKANIGERLKLESHLWTSISEAGFGGTYALNACYNTQKYGGCTTFRTIFNKYVTPSNLMAQNGVWIKTCFYEKPLEWITFGQDISYSSFDDMGIGFNTSIYKLPFPGFSYGVNVSTRGVSQSVNTSYRYKDFLLSGGYGWSQNEKDIGIRINQTIQNFQFWTGFHIRDHFVYQFGGMIPFTPWIKVKNFFTFASQNGYITQSTGVTITLRLPQNFNIHSTYEWINYNEANEHFLSFNLTNNLLFEEIGFSFVSGKVFMDMNNNGIFDVEDRTVSDVDVILDGLQRVTTNKNGTYSFSFIKRGEHSIYVDLGCMPAEIGPGQRQYKVNTEFLRRVKINVPLEELGIIEGTIFYDDNGDGEKDHNESGVPNIVVTVNGSLSTTDKKGKYRIANLAPGVYTIGVKILPPETILAEPRYTYIHLKPGEKFLNKPLAVVKKTRPVNKTIFGE
jgi:hypothetical protein